MNKQCLSSSGRICTHANKTSKGGQPSALGPSKCIVDHKKLGMETVDHAELAIILPLVICLLLISLAFVCFCPNAFHLNPKHVEPRSSHCSSAATAMPAAAEHGPVPPAASAPSSASRPGADARSQVPQLREGQTWKWGAGLRLFLRPRGGLPVGAAEGAQATAALWLPAAPATGRRPLLRPLHSYRSSLA